MDYLSRLILFFVCSLFVGVASADVPKVAGYKVENAAGLTFTSVYPSYEAACQSGDAQAVADKQSKGLGWASGYASVISGPKCQIYSVPKTGTAQPNGFVAISQSGSFCPANSTQSGSSCTCNSGFEEKNGQCVAPDKCKDVAATCAGKKGGRRNYASASGGLDAYCIPPPDDFYWDQPKYPGCNTGCTLLPSGVDVALKDDQGKTWWQGEGKFSGGTCGLVMGDDSASPDPDNPADPSKPKEPPAKPVDERCAGQTGTVNGKERSVFLHPVRRVLTGQERPRTATAPALRAKPSRHAPTAFANPPRQRPTRTQTARSRAPRPVRTR